jgi:hypothetical protein
MSSLPDLSLPLVQRISPVINSVALHDSKWILKRRTSEDFNGSSIPIEFYYIMDNDGVVKESCRQKTKLDKVITGDLKAYVTDQGHTTTLQRDN